MSKQASGNSVARRFLALDARSSCLLSQLLFLIPFGCWIAINILVLRTTYAATLQPLVNYGEFRIACLLVLVIREVLFGKWDRLSFVGLLLLAFMCYSASNGNMMIVVESMCFAFSARNLPFKKVALFAFCLLSAVFAITVVSALTGIIADTVVTKGSRVRHHLGFGHPNTCNALAFYIFLLWVCLRNKKFNLGDVIGMLAIAVGLYMLTLSRTSLILAIALSVFAFGLRFIPTRILKSPIVAVLAIGSVVVLACGSMALTCLYDPSVNWMSALNKLVSGRLALGHKAIVDNGVPLLGQVVNFTRPEKYDFATGTYITSGDKSFFIVDCAYVRLAVSCGWPFLALATLLATANNALLFKRERWHLLLVVIFAALHGVSESYIYNGTYNISLLMLGSLFYLPVWKAGKSRVDEAARESYRSSSSA